MKILCKCFVAAILVSLTQAAPPSLSSNSFASNCANSKINQQLPDDIIPVLYKIELNPDFDDDNITLNGNVEVDIIVKKTTNEITMHAKKLIINSDADLKCNHPVGDVVISTIEPINDTTESFKIILSKKLDVGTNCSLRLSYTTNGDGSTGMRRNQYTNKDGTKKFELLSKSLGRKIFPCWDDGNLRANFIISIEHNKNYIALSNMDAVKYDIDPQNSERIITHFSKSVKMKPSDMIFAVGDFIKNDDHDDKFRIWALRGFLPSVNYAQEVGPKLMRALDDYTDFPYETHGMNKVDIIITKLDGSNMGIARWGFIRFEEHGITASQNSSSNSHLELVTQTMAHELTYQWFGNLIGTVSREYQWLTEGFANYLQYVITDQIQPTWRTMDKFVTKIIQSRAFIYDSNINSRHIEWHERNSIHIFEKSGAVIRMISFILGEEKFKIAFRNYIKTKAFELATSNDFFKELTNVYTGNINLTNALKNWVTTPGYAVITVKRDYDVGKAIITQSRFLKDTNETSDEKYWIPINFVTDENLNFIDTNVTHWFDPSMNSIEIDQLKKDQFIICNKQLFGYYRVNYDDQNWKLITNYLNGENYSRIHVLNRAQLIDDAFNLAQVGQLDYKVVLSLLTYLKQETDIIPWTVAWKVIEKINNIIENTEIDEYFKKYVLELSEKLEREVMSVQLNKTDFIMADKRRKTLKWTCLLGSSLCRSEAIRKFNNWLDDPQTNALSIEEKDWIICAGIQNANQTFWDKLWDKYWITNDYNILFALGCSSDVEILKRFIVKSITKDPRFLRLSITLMIIDENKSNGVTAALDFFNEHFNEIIALHEYTTDALQSEIQFLAYKLTTKVQRDKLKIFLDANKASINNADDIIAAVDERLEIADEQLHELKDFFQKYMTKNSDSSSLSGIIPENNFKVLDEE